MYYLKHQLNLLDDCFLVVSFFTGVLSWTELLYRRALDYLLCGLVSVGERLLFTTLT